MQLNLLVQITLGCFMGMSVGCATEESPFETKLDVDQSELLEEGPRKVKCNSTSDTWEPVREAAPVEIWRGRKGTRPDGFTREDAQRECATKAEQTHVRPSECESAGCDAGSCVKDPSRFKAGPNHIKSETVGGVEYWVCKTLDYQGSQHVNMLVHCTACKKTTGTGGSTAMASPETGLAIPDYIYITGGHAIAMTFNECGEPVEATLPLASISEI